MTGWEIIFLKYFYIEIHYPCFFACFLAGFREGMMQYSCLLCIYVSNKYLMHAPLSGSELLMVRHGLQQYFIVAMMPLLFNYST